MSLFRKTYFKWKIDNKPNFCNIKKNWIFVFWIFRIPKCVTKREYVTSRVRKDARGDCTYLVHKNFCLFFVMYVSVYWLHKANYIFWQWISVSRKKVFAHETKLFRFWFLGLNASLCIFWYLVLENTIKNILIYKAFGIIECCLCTYLQNHKQHSKERKVYLLYFDRDS